MERPENPPPARLDPTTLHEVIALIEQRIVDLDRVGPPNARGHACSACKDAELHRLLGVVRGLAKRAG
jgi:hypothetical protein